jgi:hypothetical protein
MDQLMQKLMISKAIMDKTDGIKRGEVQGNSLPQSMVQEFDVPQAKYNIPQEFMAEESVSKQPYLSSIPNTKPVGSPSVDAIKNSKLPDEIKKLMMEHPISQPQQPQMTISNELVEKASRLMKEQSNNYTPESALPKTSTKNIQSTQPSSIDYNMIKKMINEAVNNALKENGLLVESSEKSNEQFSFRVGKHIFEGKVSKIKKIS